MRNTMLPSIFKLPYFIVATLSMCLLICINPATSKCAFEVDQNLYPHKVSKQPFMVQGMSLCKEYNGKMGCCNEFTDQQQISSYQSIDGIFSSLGDGCDVCAVNLKRFWCEYACSPQQDTFVEVEDGYFPVPNPQKPDVIVMVQKLSIMINAKTACDLYSSCSRNAFVSSVSAMNSPAGFLSFLGANSINDASQMMTMKFTYSTNNSIYFGPNHPDTENPQRYEQMYNCNTSIVNKTIHGFPVFKNCTCNNCATSCHEEQGFIYSQPYVLEGFNYVLVGSVWAAALAIAFITRSLRRRSLNVSVVEEEGNLKKAM